MLLDNTAIQSDWTDSGLALSDERDENIYYRITTPMIPKDLTTLVLTLASLNYIPHHHSKLLEQVAMELSQLKTTLSELVWLDSVWSLTVIGHASNDHLKSVLNQTFQNVVLLPNNKNVGATLKLLNINGETM